MLFFGNWYKFFRRKQMLGRACDEKVTDLTQNVTRRTCTAKKTVRKNALKSI